MTDTQSTALDTSVIVAALSPWHDHHAPSRRLLVELLASGEAQRVVLPRQVLLEAYSVLTRLPVPKRISPQAAVELLSWTFEQRAEVADRGAGDLWTLLQSAWQRNVAGGAIHDAAILDAAEAAGATRLYTFNPRHFERLGSRRVEILSP